MVTTEIKTIKPTGGGDYTSLSSWEAAERVDLVSADKIKVAEVYSGGTVGNVAPVEGVGWVTDPTHYPIIRAAVGHSNGGKYDTSKAFMGTAQVYVNYMNVGPGLSFNGDIDINGNGTITAESCATRSNNSFQIIVRSGGNTNRHIIRNNLLIGSGGTVTNLQMAGGKVKFYNNTVYATGFAGILGHNTIVDSQNNYIAQTGAVPCYYYGVNGGDLYGDHDATSNTEARTASLRSVAYSTANFISVTAGSEDLHLSTNSALKTKGIALSDVTNDIDGNSRVGILYDIGADQASDIPLCWNYTAKYKGSNKLFKASGCGSFPKTLRVPSNVDRSTGRMVDDGIEIDPREYRIV